MEDLKHRIVGKVEVSKIVDWSLPGVRNLVGNLIQCIAMPCLGDQLGREIGKKGDFKAKNNRPLFFGS